MEYASNGKGNLGVTLGAIGTGLSVLGGGANLLGMMPACRSANQEFVTHEVLDMAMKLAAKDSELALVKSEQNTEVKIADVYERLITRINADKNAQQEVNTQQAVYNGVNSATLGCMKNSIDQLYSLTALRIPNTSVCPGWGEVKVTPVAPTAAATTT